MKFKRAIKIATLFTIICYLNIPQNVFAQDSFYDISGHWAESYINKIKNFGLINGFNGEFKPDEPITRGELAVILDKLMSYKNKAENNYLDLDNNFYTDAILKLTKEGIIFGADNLVRPKDNVTREEMAVIIARVFDLNTDGYPLDFSDASQVSTWAKDSVSYLSKEGIITGYNGKFRPKDTGTRAEAVTILKNILGEYYNQKGTFSPSNVNKTVVVATNDVVIEDTVIDKDLIITAGVGEGDVTLNNVTVNGRTLVYGGGKHSIHIKGNSSLGDIEVSKQGGPIRIFSENTASVGSVLLKEDNTDTIVEGNFNNVKSLSSDTQLEIRGDVKNLSLQGQNSTISLASNSSVDKVSIPKGAKNNNIIVDKTASISNIATSSNLNIKGEGKVENVTKSSDDVSISVPSNMKTNIKTETITTNKNNNSITGGSGDSYDPNNTNNTNNTNNLNQNQDLKIVSIESVKNGLVRFKLDKKFQGTLTKDMVSIICTSGGSDMTVLDVKTNDNITFDVTTAYYKDNVYSLAITLPNNKLIEKSFEVRSLAPTISSMSVERKTENTANVMYVSDTPGKFYYIAEETKLKRSALSKLAPTEDEIVKNGVSLSMKTGGNEFNISNLKANTPYILYFVAEDLGGNRTVVKQEAISANINNPQVGDVEIVSAEGFFKNNGFFGENHWFEFRLNKAVPLEFANFTITCPAQGNLTLGRLETKDNINYKVYMKKGYVPSSDNNYTVKITLKDGNVITKKFFVDYVAPNITGFTAKRTAQNKAEVIFNSDEAGHMYYKVLPNSSIPQDITPKDPNEIIKGGAKVAINEGANKIDLSNIDAQNVSFCFVTEDARGNILTYYDYKKIPNNITAPEPTTPENQLPFTVSNVRTYNAITGDTRTCFDVDFKPDFNGWPSDITITNTSGVYIIKRDMEVENSSLSPNKFTIKLRKHLLSTGEYKITIKDGDKTGTSIFNVN